VDWYFAHVMSTTGILHHAVVCRVITVSNKIEGLVSSKFCNILIIGSLDLKDNLVAAL
jgi:hypothetical protein